MHCLRRFATAAVYAAALIVVRTPPALAQFFHCLTPQTPSCVTWSMRFEDDFAIESCRRDMQTYQRHVDEYRRCVTESANSVREQFDRDMRRFECRARRESFCP